MGGRGGRAGRVGGAKGSLSDGGGGARRFLLLRGVEFVFGLGLEQGVEVLLWDMVLFSTTKEWDPSKRFDQLGASFLSSQPMRKLPSVSSILLWIISVILLNLPGELIPIGNMKTNQKLHLLDNPTTQIQTIFLCSHLHVN